jgi:uncharacterized Tic20 family protein
MIKPRHLYYDGVILLSEENAMDQNNSSITPPSPSPYTPAQPLTPADERTWAMLAHLSGLLNLITGFLGIIAALVIYLVFKDRSRYVAYQSMQSFLFQLIFWLGGGILAVILWVVTASLTLVLVGLLCVPLACIVSFLPLGALVYGIVGAVECNSGHNFRYWLIGDWARGELIQS